MIASKILRATSSGDTIVSRRAPGMPARVMKPVSTAPGSTYVTAMSSGTSSRRRIDVALRNAAFDGGYAPMPPTGTRATPLPIMKTCPRDARSVGSASRTSASGPSTCVPNCALQRCVALHRDRSGRRRAGVVHQHVDVPERADRAADQARRVGRIADVGDVGRDRAALFADLRRSAASARTLRPTAYTA